MNECTCRDGHPHPDALDRGEAAHALACPAYELTIPQDIIDRMARIELEMVETRDMVGRATSPDNDLVVAQLDEAIERQRRLLSRLDLGQPAEPAA